ncbi:bacteriophage spanin2 family protein [Saccharothrix longispora]|uniref:bacteriophage spanin2 family protein n=1 Tax=Saccharothrix longispora TaxID=33920 RepID=UPI0028FD5BEA|nr:bacteriophage spanin2 family protein [Saccharothrix longispora]MBY8848968.1 bacteriophage spanin2 family protein [Saccharothrix sp. MB29]MDU0288348.1 bacteriophage spanin2 family protein [Saccharothrix longispora]
MRTSTRLATAVTGLVAVGALTACGAVQEAADTANAVANTANAVQVCADALSRATTSFDTSSPERAVDQAHETAASLGDLASQAADTTVNQAITALAGTLGGVTLDDLVVRPAVWLETKARQVAALTTACTP